MILLSLFIVQTRRFHVLYLLVGILQLHITVYIPRQDFFLFFVNFCSIIMKSFLSFDVINQHFLIDWKFNHMFIIIINVYRHHQTTRGIERISKPIHYHFMMSSNKRYQHRAMQTCSVYYSRQQTRISIPRFHDIRIQVLQSVLNHVKCKKPP